MKSTDKQQPLPKIELDFIKSLYEDGLVEKELDENAWADIRGRRLDRVTKERNVALYGYLVGLGNARRAVRFVEMAEGGRSVPGDFVKGYLPIIQMIDDIVAAGPGAVRQLQNLHKRFK